MSQRTYRRDTKPLPARLRWSTRRGTSLKHRFSHIPVAAVCELYRSVNVVSVLFVWNQLSAFHNRGASALEKKDYCHVRGREAMV